MMASTVLLSAAAPAAPDPSDSGWEMGEPRLPTPWTEEVSPDNALPDYPRPQLTRANWQNLNGVWEFAGATAGAEPPFGQTLGEQVLVPYPIESVLSGIERHEDYMWYRKNVSVPNGWRIGNGQRLMLNFGAVDYKSVVYVNGEQVAEHTGGYGRFSADITDAVTGSGAQEIIVGVEDRTDATWQPVGKQRRVPDRGIFYEGASGIWQTVWMEPVADGHVGTLDMTPDLDASALRLTVNTVGDTGGLTVEATVRDGRTMVSRTSGAPGAEIALPVTKAKLWSPDSPFLYNLEVRLKNGDEVVDSVGSYFGMREIGKAKGADGRLHMTLNGEIVFQMSTLDQGYWPDGIYTAPTDDALAFDLEQHKELGFNTVRKHIKVEPDRWFYHADRLGLLVWQDMPAMRTGGRPPVDGQQQFETELHEMVDQHKSWTSVIGWVPFNEGWGEWDRDATGRIADDIKAQDPSRLVNAHSGVNCCDSLGDSGQGDVIDWHRYVGPADPVPQGERVSIDGEHGGFGLEVDDHMWFGEGHAYEMTPDPETLTRRYVENQEDVLTAAKQCGISGAIYTQITDVEHEVNGFFTYDRQVEKMDFGQVRDINEKIIREADGSGSDAPDLPPGTPGLTGLAYWPADEGSGTVAADQVGDADLTLRPGASWTAGVSGSALAFDGAGGHAETDGPVLDTSGSFTAAAWVKLDRVNGWLTAVGQDGPVQSAFFLQKTADTNRFSFSTAGGRALSDFVPVADRWYHLTGMRDAATGTHTLYVDGVEQSSFSQCLNPDSEGPLSIGRARFGGNDVDFWPGAVDDVRVWDRALSAEEVAEIAATGR